MRSSGRLTYAFIGVCLAIVPVLLAQSKPDVPSHSFAILIGVQDYSASGLSELPYASKDTDMFLHHLSSARGGAVGKEDPKEAQEFVTPGASGASKNLILAGLSQIVTQQAGPNDVVYILITARSEVPLQSKEIFIDVAKSSPEKKDSQISLSELKKILQENRAARKIVFADLSGNLSADRRSAEIGDRVKQLLILDNLSGVLVADLDGSAPATVKSDGGHRVFPYLLVSGLQSPSGKFEGFPVDQNSDHLISFAEIRNFLQKYMPEYTKRLSLNNGMIQPFGDPRAPDVSLSYLTKPGLAELAWNPIRSRNSLAGNIPFAGLGFAFSDTPNRDQFSPEVKTLLDRFSMQLQLGNLIGNGSARELLEQLDKLGFDKKLLGQRVAILAAALRDQGQEQITWYGTGDRFTVDPKWQEREATTQDYQKAVDAFRTVLELEPSAPDRTQMEARLDFCLGRIEMIAGNATAAATSFGTANSKDPKFAEALNALGVLNFQTAKFEDALRYFQEASKPAEFWAYPRHNAALAYIELGRYDEALSEYRTAIQKTPYYPYLHYNLGVLLQRLNRPREAEARYRIALDLFGKQAIQEELRSQHWRTAGNREESERADLQSQLLKRNIAAVYVAMGSLNPKEAANLYRKALSHDIDSIAASHNLALLQQKEKSADLNAVATLLEGNLKKEGAFEPSELALAATYFQMGRFTDAEQIYTRVGLDNRSALAGWARASAAEGKTGDAIDQLAAAVRKQHDSGFVSPELAMTLGDLYQSRGDLRDACGQFRSAVQTLSELPDETSLEKEAKSKLKECKTLLRAH